MNRRCFVGGLIGSWMRPRVAVRDTPPPALPFGRGSLVAVLLDRQSMIGEVGEKVAGGLFEIIFTIDNTQFSGVFRMDELQPVCGGQPGFDQ